MKPATESVWWNLERLFKADDLSEASIDAKAQAVMELALFTANLTLSVVGAVLVALIAYFWIHRNQKANLEISTRKERLEVLHALEETILGLHARMSILDPSIQGEHATNEDGLFELRSALDDRPWQAPENGPSRANFYKGRRVWLIRPSEDAYIDSQALHELLIWFRRTERAIHAGLVTGDDLFRLWRQILPLVINGRDKYLKQYFSHEVRSVRDVAGFLIADCQHAHDTAKDAPLAFLRSYRKDEKAIRMDEECLQDLANGIVSKGRLGQSKRIYIDDSLYQKTAPTVQ